MSARPPRRRRKEARPREILRAALETFAEKGFAAARLEDVALRAGIGKGTLYLYFSSKEELLRAVVREALVPNIARAERLAARHAGSCAELLRLIVELAGRRISRSRLSALPKVVLAEASNFPEVARFYFDEVISRGFGLLGGIVRRGIEQGEFRPIDAEHAARLLMAPLLFLALWRHSFARVAPGPLDPIAFCRAHLDMALHGLLREPGNG
ncbi:MAG TPA: TetR/AcrR family transcriptional regulator [Geminicoccaceae bacterium]|nr:TetR/AcrR family transcriptional regulator [Geminicoccus sp.]HMU48809.1 TetR/AcrR family transcriptional regulator [Geminicoccaceae bacterium]